MFKDILDKFGKSEGIKFEYKSLPIKRLYSEFFKGNLDFKIPDNSYWKKDVKDMMKLDISYSDPVLTYIDGIMSTKKINNLGELKTLGIVSGFTPWGYQDLINSKKVKVRENPSLKGLLQQALLGRVDGVYVNIAVGKEYLKSEFGKKEELKLQKDIPFIKSNYHLATIKHKKLIQKFNKFLKDNSKLLKTYENKIQESFK